MRISIVWQQLCEAAIDDALGKLCITTNEHVALTITVHPSNIYEAGRCTAAIRGFENTKITIKTNPSFNRDEWMLQYKEDYIRTGADVD